MIIKKYKLKQGQMNLSDRIVIETGIGKGESFKTSIFVEKLDISHEKNQKRSIQKIV